MQIILGLILGIVISVLAWRAGALSSSGALAAALSGGLIFGFGGISWAVLLLAFFISSSALSRAFSKRKANLNEKFAKGSRRDWSQALANGGFGALMAVIYAIRPDTIWPWIAFAGSMAAVNSDTWATEIGVLSKTTPRLITSGKIVERGASGGISLTGSWAALAGSALIGLFAGLFAHQISTGLLILIAVTIGGVAGSFFDSLLGATVQAIYYCPSCDKETERHPHHLCGAETQRFRGWAWLNNDLVNFSASIAGAAVASGLYFLLA